MTQDATQKSRAIIEIELRYDNTNEMMKLFEAKCDAALGTGAGRYISGGRLYRYWVAEITGSDPKFKLARNFLPYKKDYSRANSKGSRGVYGVFTLESGKVYEVNEFKNKYYCKVVDWRVVRIPETEVCEWVKGLSASMS